MAKDRYIRAEALDDDTMVSVSVEIRVYIPGIIDEEADGIIQINSKSTRMRLKDTKPFIDSVGNKLEMQKEKKK